jgi:hypothetical protein
MLRTISHRFKSLSPLRSRTIGDREHKRKTWGFFYNHRSRYRREMLPIHDTLRRFISECDLILQGCLFEKMDASAHATS